MADSEVEPFRIAEPIYVLCEGPADVRLVEQLLKRDGLSGFSVNYAQGYQRFAQHVRGLTASSGWRRVKRLLIMGDNDTHPTARWTNALNALAHQDLPTPSANAELTPSAPGRPSTGIFMLPRADTEGALETLLVEAILREHEGLEACLTQLDDCPATDCAGWDTVKRAKMRLQTAVAILCRDDPSAGAAHLWSKTHNPVPVESPVFDELAGFLRRAALAEPNAVGA